MQDRSSTLPTGNGDSFASTLWRNVRYGARRLAATPGFTATAVLSLALGIGANTAIFTLIDAVLLRDVPYRQPDELVNLYIAFDDSPYNVFSYPDFKDLRDGTREVFAGISGTRLTIAQTDRDGAVEMLPAEVVTGNYFELMGIGAAVGRTLGPDDDVAPGGHPVTVLSHRYWQSAFGSDPGIVGRSIRVSGLPYTIVGVVDADYEGNFRGVGPSVYVPMMMINEIESSGTDSLTNRGQHSTFVRARMHPGTTTAQIQAAMDAVSTRLIEQDVDSWTPGVRFSQVPSADVVLYPPFDRFVRAAAWLLMVVVGLVLLMACMNLASFLLARALDRRKEIAVRLALGANRRALVGQLVTETTLLGVLGGVVGLALAMGLMRALIVADLPLPIPVTLDLGLNTTVLSFNFAVALAAGMLLGLAPALQGTRADVATTLKSETAGAGRPGKLSLRNGLVVAQVAASLVLLVGAGLFLRSFQAVQSVDPGFGRDPAALLSVMIPANRFTEDEGRIFTRTLLDRYRGLPGVEAVGLTDRLHLDPMNNQSMGFNVDGFEPPPDLDGQSADRCTVDAGFFDAAGVRLVAGRNFAATDLPDSPRVAIVSEALARRFWTTPEAALGQHLRRGGDEDITVVGVASDAKSRSLGEAPRAFVYLPYSQSYRPFLTIVARTSLDADQLALQLHAVGREVDPDLWIWEAKTMDRHLGVMLLPSRLAATLLSVFAGLALALAVVGLYGIVSYAVAQRTREVGIRVSLGASNGRVVGMLMGSGLRLVAVGGAVGLVLALGLSRLLGALLFGVATFDIVTFLAVPLVLAGAAVLAAWIPARRASRVNPVSALRSE